MLKMGIETVAEFKEIAGTIAKTPKRHNKILQALLRDHNLAVERGKPPNEIVREFLVRRLSHNEGVLLNSATFTQLFGKGPERDKIRALAYEFSLYNLFLVPVFYNVHNIIIIVIHKENTKALEYAQKLQQVFTKTPPDEEYQITYARIKVMQEIIQEETTTPKVIVDSLHVMDDNEVFYVGEDLTFYSEFDPRQIISMAEAKGYKVLVLQRDMKDDETQVPEFNFFEKFIGLIISKTDAGIEIGKKRHLFMRNLEKQDILDAMAEDEPMGGHYRMLEG